MKTIDAILTRKSVRKYSDKDISRESLELILKAGQAGPSAKNKRDWQFIVVKEKETLNKMAGFLGAFIASPLKEAKMAILILGDVNLSADDNWQIDCTIAAQNMILVAHELGIGSCWIGTFPNEGKMKFQRKLFDLPKNVIPHSIITFGYPLDPKGFYDLKEGKPDLEEKKIHYEKW